MIELRTGRVRPSPSRGGRVAGTLVVLLALGPCAGQPDRSWNDAFTLASGWNAGDIGHSLDLGDGRTLWLFGDSIVGPVRDGARVAGESKMVRGAIAWHETPPRGAVPEQVAFAVPDPGLGVPVAPWLRPEAAMWPPDSWYWFMNDGATITDAGGERRLILFTTAIGPSGNPEGMWNFRRLGGAILSIENPGDDPPDWRAAQRANPLVTDTPRFDEPARPSTNWALAIVAWPPEAPPSLRTLFVYGLRSGGPAESSLLVARCAESHLADTRAWTFFDGAGWTDDSGAAAPIATGLVDEFTIQPVRRGERDELVLVQSEPMLGLRILARTAPAPEGPWSEPVPIYDVPEPAAADGLITYAAKGHAHLSPPGELLVTYALNSADFGQIFRDASLYRPRFVRVPIGSLPASP
ncbi:MAG TPA: hypothetical protein VFF69_13970 [Phycisphaerales bacterium]|nr:hypothetical protein [Phycisphaerales bacterium]